jgi:hypothetical protein
MSLPGKEIVNVEASWISYSPAYTNTKAAQKSGFCIYTNENQMVAFEFS